MNPKDEEGFDREAWRRELGDAGEPSQFTDARIRAEARRALAPRIGRWWLPASLAASLVLAVFLVQWQFEDERRAPIVDESDVIDQDLPADAPASAPMMELPATAAEEPLRRDESQERARELKRDSKLEEYAVTPAPPPSEREETPADDDAVRSLGNIAAKPTAPAAVAPAPAASKREAAAEDTSAITGALHSKQAAVADARTPEQWYADIEALRAAGKDAEADAELEKLEAAYPGWLESRQPDDR